MNDLVEGGSSATVCQESKTLEVEEEEENKKKPPQKGRISHAAATTPKYILARHTRLARDRTLSLQLK